MNDLDTRLERLAAEATRDAVAPEPEAIARRGRRRRRRQLAGSAVVVAAVVAAGLVLPARLAGRPGPVPAAAPATDVSDAARLGGYWFGKTDASVYLRLQVTPGPSATPSAGGSSPWTWSTEVYYESQGGRVPPAAGPVPQQARGRRRHRQDGCVPASFRVRLHRPRALRRAAELRALTRRGSAATSPDRRAQRRRPCMDGVDTVLHDRASVEALLVPKPSATSSDVSRPASRRRRRRGPGGPGPAGGDRRGRQGDLRDVRARRTAGCRRSSAATTGTRPAVTPLVHARGRPGRLPRHPRPARPGRASSTGRSAAAAAPATGGGLVVLEHPRR